MTARAIHIICALLLLSCEQPMTDSEFSSRVERSHSVPGDTVVGVVEDILTRRPLKSVRVGWQGTNIQAVTDVNGRFVIQRHSDFNWLIFEGEDIFQSTAKISPNYLLWRRQNRPDDVRAYLNGRAVHDNDALDDPDLKPRARALLARSRGQLVSVPELTDDGLRLKTAGMPPQNVRVYRRGSENNSCEGRVDVIPLETYVRGVLPNEWIASWDEESLRAGAIAARSYAWGHILNGGKYTCADVDDTSRSQVYRELYNARADDAVRGTAGIGIYDPEEGQVVTSEYSSENQDPTAFGVCEPLCTGEDLFGHGRGMCQHGTQRWASIATTQAHADALESCSVVGPAPLVGQGQTAEWMVAHYYPGKYTTALEDTGADLYLSQRIERVNMFSCARPNDGFGCADFIPDGVSNGIFDAYLGQQIRQIYVIENRGSDVALGVKWRLSIPEGIRVLQIDAPGIVSRTEDSITVEFASLEPNEEGMVSLIIEMASAGRLELKPFVADVEGQYQKSAWSEAPTLNVGQTYNDGELRQFTAYDGIEPSRWDFVRNRAYNPQGWYGADVFAESVEQGLRLVSTAGSWTVESPHLYGVPRTVSALTVRSIGPITVAVRNPSQSAYTTLGTGDGISTYELADNAVFQIRLSGASGAVISSIVFDGESPRAEDMGLLLAADDNVNAQIADAYGLAFARDSEMDMRSDSISDANGHSVSTVGGNVSQKSIRSSGACAFVEQRRDSLPSWLLLFLGALRLRFRETLKRDPFLKQ